MLSNYQLNSSKRRQRGKIFDAIFPACWDKLVVLNLVVRILTSAKRRYMKPSSSSRDCFLILILNQQSGRLIRSK